MLNREHDAGRTPRGEKLAYVRPRVEIQKSVNLAQDTGAPSPLTRHELRLSLRDSLLIPRRPCRWLFSPLRRSRARSPFAAAGIRRALRALEWAKHPRRASVNQRARWKPSPPVGQSTSVPFLADSRARPLWSPSQFFVSWSAPSTALPLEPGPTDSSVGSRELLPFPLRSTRCAAGIPRIRAPRQDVSSPPGPTIASSIPPPPPAWSAGLPPPTFRFSRERRPTPSPWTPSSSPSAWSATTTRAWPRSSTISPSWRRRSAAGGASSTRSRRERARSSPMT